MQFTSTRRYSDNSVTDITNDVTWTSSDNTIATIDSSGLAQGLAEGQTVITATRINTLLKDDGVAVCTAEGTQSYQQLVSDGAGGAIITWQDARSKGNNDIYIQCINASGKALWAKDGVTVCAAWGDRLHPQIISDGLGGAIISWRAGRVYVQRIDANGNRLWSPNGIVTTHIPGTTGSTRLVSDGAGGAIAMWYNRGNIYVQRINASGKIMWSTDGVLVNSGYADKSPKIVSDGAGGAIITWEDYRSDQHRDIYAQRVDASGNTLWADGGIAICTAPEMQDLPKMVSDGSGGAIIVWSDDRGDFGDVYVQRVDASGNTLLKENGIAICALAISKGSPAITSDNLGGAIITWMDSRDEGKSVTYAQRLDASGNRLWADEGVAICTVSGGQYFTEMVCDGAGGAIITWTDHRGEVAAIYAQRVDALGNTLWTADGMAVFTHADSQFIAHYQSMSELIADGAGGAIITWKESSYDPEQLDPDGCAPTLAQGIYVQFITSFSNSTKLTVKDSGT